MERAKGFEPSFPTFGCVSICCRCFGRIFKKRSKARFFCKFGLDFVRHESNVVRMKESRHARRSICLKRTPLVQWPEGGCGGDGANMPRFSTEWRQI